jgi:hypothetical protein
MAHITKNGSAWYCRFYQKSTLKKQGNDKGLPLSIF